MRRLLVVFLVACVGFCFSYREAFAEKRVALVIGNSNYKNVPQLPNPANDAAAMADMFRAANFDVVEAAHDLGNQETRRLLVASNRGPLKYSRAPDVPVLVSQYSVTLSSISSRDSTFSGCPSQSVHAWNFSMIQAHCPAGESARA